MAKTKRKGRSVKKNRAQGAELEAPELLNAPHSFVLHRGDPCPYITELTRDYRQMMEPFTASSLKEKKSNRIKDFLSLSGIFHVSHMCIFNRSKTQLSFKVARMPRGPTLTFKIHQFTLTRDIIASTKKQYADENVYSTAPLVILNSFTGEGKHLKLMASTFQNMFPTINLTSVQLSTINRCVVLSYNPTTKCIDLRHYAIGVAPVGLTKGIKKVVTGKVPNLSRCNDISDFVSQSNLMSDSEFEDDETGHVVVPQKLKSRGTLENNKSKIVLHELGPRLTFQLIKIEDGMMNGEVLYHDQIVKTEEEKEEIKKLREKKKKLKEHRKKTQTDNKLKKEEERENHKKKSMKGVNVYRNEAEDEQPDDDAAYYREEVGEEPDHELFKPTNGGGRPYVPKFSRGNNKRKSDDKPGSSDNKKRKFDGPDHKKGKFSKGDRDDKKKKFTRKDDRGDFIKKGRVSKPNDRNDFKKKGKTTKGPRKGRK